MVLTFGLPVQPVIVESPVYAEIQQNTKIYRDRNLRSPIGEVSTGDSVEILGDFSFKVYKIATSQGQTGWISVKFLNIPSDAPTDRSMLGAAQLEDFVDTKEYKSTTTHLILTDINRQKVYIFNGSQGNWKLEKIFDCSTGTNLSPTTRGIFKLADRGEWFYSHRLASGAKYWIRFNGHYLFHSTPMDKNKRSIISEDIVGEKRSNGCVRLLLDDIKWIYDNILDGTTVVIL